MKKINKLLSFILAFITVIGCGTVLSACKSKKTPIPEATIDVLNRVLNSYLQNDYEIFVDDILVVQYDADNRVEGSCYDLSVWTWVNDGYYFTKEMKEEEDTDTFKYMYSNEAWTYELLKDLGADVLISGTINEDLENDSDNYKIQASKTEADKTITYTWTFDNSKIIEIECTDGTNTNIITVSKADLDIDLPEEAIGWENEAIDMTNAE